MGNLANSVRVVAPSFERGQKNIDECARCGRDVRDHDWYCTDCGRLIEELEPCGCGTTHLPKLCHSSANLLCRIH